MAKKQMELDVTQGPKQRCDNVGASRVHILVQLQLCPLHSSDAGRLESENREGEPNGLLLCNELPDPVLLPSGSVKGSN